LRHITHSHGYQPRLVKIYRWKNPARFTRRKRVDPHQKQTFDVTFWLISSTRESLNAQRGTSRQYKSAASKEALKPAPQALGPSHTQAAFFTPSWRVGMLSHWGSRTGTGLQHDLRPRAQLLNKQQKNKQQTQEIAPWQQQTRR
jgi:hypothetical protein